MGSSRSSPKTEGGLLDCPGLVGDEGELAADGCAHESNAVLLESGFLERDGNCFLAGVVAGRSARWDFVVER
jgi:hypothetical protein